jgi:hypothetical protein
MIKLGIVDFDTSHVVEFTRRLNHRDIAPEQWVDGARVVAGCPGESQMAPERIPGFRAEMEQLGVPLFDQPADLPGRIDGVLICSLEGGAHLERARPFLEAGLPCFVDKPFACGVDEARRIAALAAAHNAPVFSSSALRYAPEVVSYLADPTRGSVLGVVSYGPATMPEQKWTVPRNPGLFHYGIHTVELMYTLMGPGCVRVSCASEQDADVVTGRWADGRLATVRGLRSGRKLEYGFVAFSEHATRHVAVGVDFVYRELLKQVVMFFRTGRSPLDVGVTVELMAFLEAALRSAGKGGAPEEVGA